MSPATRTTFEVEDIHILEVINNPLRLRILNQLASEPKTVREVAERMEVPVTRLYYHLNLLEEAGVIEVVETRKSGARLQRVYRAIATRFQPGPELLSNVEDKRQLAEAAAGAVLDGARLDAVAGLLRHFGFMEGADPDEVPGNLGRTVVPMSREAAVELTERIGELMAEINEREDLDGEEYAFSFVFFPMVAPVKGERL